MLLCIMLPALEQKLLSGSYFAKLLFTTDYLYTIGEDRNELNHFRYILHI